MGFELRRDTLNRVGRAAVIMSCVPALFEILGVVLVGPKLIHISYLDAAILGAILGAVLPAVVVPIMIMGERVLDYGERSSYRFSELRDSMGLPRVGERVYDKRSGKVFKVIEEKEVWLIETGPAAGTVPLETAVPAIQFRFWKEDSSNGPGTAKTIFCQYSQQEAPFQNRWEILYDW